MHNLFQIISVDMYVQRNNFDSNNDKDENNNE